MITIDNKSKHVNVVYDEKLRLTSIQILKGCDRIEWEAVRHSIEFQFLDNSDLVIENDK